MTLNTINSTDALQTAVYALIAIIENHPLTDSEYDTVYQAYQGVGSMLTLADAPERGVTVAERNQSGMQYVQPAMPFKKQVIDLALHRAFAAMTLKFCTPLSATDGLVEYINDAAGSLVEWSVL